jgi:predicted Rossmann fold flavoprotein
MPTGQINSVADVAIVGGGAAGLATAIFVARRHPTWRVVLLDGAKKLGAKILISGGGRCNVTNDVVTADDFCGGSRHVIRRVLAAFPADETATFFRELGVSLHVEPGGKMFPDTNRARTVLDALLGDAARCGVQILAGRRVTGISRTEAGFELATPSGAIHARRAVLATGGRSVPKTGSDGAGYALAQLLGHSLVPQTPALVPLILDGEFHIQLSGVSQDVEIIVRVEGAKPTRLRGPMLWTHFGVSGPVVLNASRHWHAARLENRNVSISVSFLPGDSFERVERRLIDLASKQSRVAIHNALATLLPARVAEAVVTTLGIDRTTPTGQLAREVRRRLAQALIDWSLHVRDSRGYQYAEVTAGGVPLDEIDPRTMESRKCPGLYLVGEILDVDGRIGGFNFQWAWSSAWVAAAAIGSNSFCDSKSVISNRD